MAPTPPCLSTKVSSPRLICSMTQAQWNPLTSEFVWAIEGVIGGQDWEVLEES